MHYKNAKKFEEKKASIHICPVLKETRSFCNFQFLRFSVKEISFPSLTGDLFVTFNHVELMRFLIDC